MRIVCGTHYVNTEEACLNLSEMNLVRPDSKGINRYMIITVLRPNGPEEFRIDLGPAKAFPRPELRFPTGGQDASGRYWSVHTVGEAVDVANHLREGPYEQPEPPPTRDLIRAYHDQPDLRRRARKKLSTFGGGGVVQRS